MDSKVEGFYRSIFTDLVVSPEEAQELIDYFKSLNPPPDKLVWLRATAFRLGCEFLSDDADKNVALLRAINAVVHSLEFTCMLPRSEEGNSEMDADATTEFYAGLYSDLSIDREESQELVEFFQSHIPPKGSLVTMRALAFKAAVEHLGDDKATNVSLLRCINVIVHNFERTCLVPRKYELKLEPSFNLDVTLNEAIQDLWKLDVNRLTPDADYSLNVQSGKKPYWKEDSAPDPLFDKVDRSVWQRPTYKTFMALLDNYKAEIGKAEYVPDVERREIWSFLNAIMETAPMQFCHKYCHAKDPSKIPSDERGFMKLLHKIWFELYRRSRGGHLDSSGFEHVFVGEVKDDAVSGFHNWVQFYIEEKKGNLDYRGYIKPRSRNSARTDSNDHVLTFQFSWNGIEKFVGTSFVGVSPEFEMALYTICFLIGEENNEVELDTGTDVFLLNIRCYKMARDKIGTAFPEATAHYD
eukprot:CAMPEP_0119551048 /NCGR_PEP_ID=MMETSP1352-20130426/4432_1 /TAXON_ID=265584 /ORGANISM="Stauroneis constricta, Strain CCMP1120" /LENGTH=467 /DNA_ID=CAMNT_0007597055 /DNA_START=90 /DNA_END=1493 /DNA_ORIENTATION=-